MKKERSGGGRSFYALPPLGRTVSAKKIRDLVPLGGQLGYRPRWLGMHVETKVDCQGMVLVALLNLLYLCGLFEMPPVRKYGSKRKKLPYHVHRNGFKRQAKVEE